MQMFQLGTDKQVTSVEIILDIMDICGNVTLILLDIHELIRRY